jgi:hypothetical protein
MSSIQKLTIAFALGRTAFGAGLIAAPGRVGASWLGSDAERPPVHVAIRGLGARDVALAAGAAWAAVTDGELRPWLVGTVAGDLVDVAATLAAGDHLSDRARLGTIALAGGSAVVGAALAAAAER